MFAGAFVTVAIVSGVPVDADALVDMDGVTLAPLLADKDAAPEMELENRCALEYVTQSACVGPFLMLTLI